MPPQVRKTFMPKRKGKIRYKTSNKIRDYGQEIDHKDGSHTVIINKKKNKKSGKGELIDSLVHETYHAKHPKASEKKTYKYTQKRLKRMSSKARRKLYAKLNK